MTKNMIKWVAGVAVILSGAAGVQAAESVEARLETLQAEIDLLKAEQLKNKSALVEVIDQATTGLEFGAALEAEAFYGESGGESESDLTLATAEFTVDAEISEGINAHVGLLWEEDDTEENNLDEAYVTFGATDDIPYYLTLGKTYLPFGNFESVFISDPLTLELAELNESAALVGYANNILQVVAGAFKGDSEEESALENMVAAITLSPCNHFSAGAYWISDLVETDGLESFVDAEKQAGAGIFLNAQIGEVAVNAEFVTALSDIETDAGEMKPYAYNIEASLPVTEKLEMGVKYEGSDEFADLNAAGDAFEGKFADEQDGLVAAYAVNDHVTVASEYLHAEGLDDDENGELFTMQVALEF